jgi:hypothetical protein
VADAANGQRLLALAAAGRNGDDVVELARAVCLAAIVEPALLRAARREVLHSGDAGLESDLWFSPLVATRNAQGIALAQDVLHVLREQLAQDETFARDARRVLERLHAQQRPAIQLEETLIWEAVRADEDAARGGIDEALQRAARAMKHDDDGGRAAARWTAHAWPRLPDEVTRTETAQLLAAGVFQRLGVGGLLEGDALPQDVGWLAPEGWNEDDLIPIGVEVTIDALRFVEPGARAIKAPPTTPVLVEVAWSDGVTAQTRVVAAAVGVEVPLGPVVGPLTLRTVDGTRHTLAAQGSEPGLEPRAEDTLGEACRLVAGRFVGYRVAPGRLATAAAVAELQPAIAASGPVAIIADEDHTSRAILDPRAGVVLADGARWTSVGFSAARREIVTGVLDGAEFVCDGRWPEVIDGAPVLVQDRLAGQFERRSDGEVTLVPAAAVADALSRGQDVGVPRVYLGPGAGPRERKLSHDVITDHGYELLDAPRTPVLDRATLRLLAQCDAAIVPVTPDSDPQAQLEVLLWRRSLDPALPVIPMPEGEFSLRMAGVVELAVSPRDRAALNTRLGGLVRRRDLLLALLERIDRLLLGTVPAAATAQELLATSVARVATGGPYAVVELVAELSSQLPAPAAEQLVALAALLNLSPAAAAVIRDGFERPSKPALYLATSDERVAELYVEYAWIDAVAPPVRSFARPQSTGILDLLAKERPSGIVLVDLPAGDLTDVRALHETYPDALFVFCGREQLAPDRGAFAALVAVEPAIEPEYESAALQVLALRERTASAVLSDDELLLRHVPVLRFDSEERFFPCSAATMTDNVGADDTPNALVRADGTVLAVAGGSPPLSLDFLGGQTYANGAPARPDDYLRAAPNTREADARRHQADPRYADRVYGRALRKSGNLFLQYWLFYYHDDYSVLGAGEHEGDWEVIQLRLASDGSPLDAALSHRADVNRVRWQDLEHADTHAPVVYVARGSHSNHARPGKHGGLVARDRADGRGRLSRPALERFGERWSSWPGRWGANKLGAVAALSRQSPRGPRFRVAWSDPARYHAGGTKV